MADSVIVEALQGDQKVSIDLTPQWSKETTGREQTAVTEGNAKYIPDSRKTAKMCPEIPPGFAPPRGWQGCSHGMFAPHWVYSEQPKQLEPIAPVKRGRGRPKGSKNKPKVQL